MTSAMHRYGEFVTKHPIVVTILSIVISIGLIMGVQNLRFTNDYRYFFTNDNPYLTAFEELERTYTSPDTLLFVYQPKDGTKAVSREALSLADELTTNGWQLPYSIRIDSLTNFQNTRAIGEDDLEVRDLVRDPSSLSDDDLAYVEATILKEPLLAGRLLAHDARTAAVFVSLKAPRDNPAATNELIAAARALLSDMRAKYPNIRIELTGSQMLSQSFAESAQRDLSTLTPMMFVIIAVVLILATRSIFGTLASMIVVTLSAATAMGAAGWVGVPLSPPASGAPTIILTVAVADCVHLLISALARARHGQETSDCGKPENQCSASVFDLGHNRHWPVQLEPV